MHKELLDDVFVDVLGIVRRCPHDIGEPVCNRNSDFLRLIEVDFFQVVEDVLCFLRSERNAGYTYILRQHDFLIQLLQCREHLDVLLGNVMYVN